MNAAKHVSCHWFRKDLRLHDNPALQEALRNADIFYGVFILPPLQSTALASGNRWKFLIQCLQDLDQSLQKISSKLIILAGSPAEMFPRVFKRLGITKLTYEVDSEPFSQQRDWMVSHLAEKAGVEVKPSVSHTLYDIEALSAACHQESLMQFGEFVDMLSEIGLPVQPVKGVDCTTRMTQENLDCLCNEKVNVVSLQDIESKVEGISSSLHNGKWKGGEKEGLMKLQDFIEEMVKNDFQQPPVLSDVLHSSKGVLCPYLRFGCLSPRKAYYSLQKAYIKVKECSPPMSVFSTLLWREFSFLQGSQNPDLHKMADNPLCLQVPWNVDQNMLDNVKQGKTGFPWIDAIMRQLRQEGWIHPAAQHAIGCFLTWGTLWISWEEGFKIFGELMLDAGWSRNACNWLYMSHSMFVNKPMPYHCPVAVAKRIDPSGDYIRYLTGGKTNH